MFRYCHRILLVFLTFWSLSGVAETAQNKEPSGLSERLWLASHHELVVGMPSVAWSPYIYTSGHGDFSGPLDDFMTTIASHLGLTLRYKVYPFYADAQQALLGHEVDMLIGVNPNQNSDRQMAFTSALMVLPRGVLLAGKHSSLSLAEARKMRWVCERGFSACDGLQRLGIRFQIEADSSEEAAFMIKNGLADAYLADLPSLRRQQRLQHQAGLAIVTPEWVTDTSLSIAVEGSNSVLARLLEQALSDIPLADRNRMLETAGILDDEVQHGPRPIIFNQQEREWLLQHPELKFAVAPNWPSMSELGEDGQIKGYLADLIKLMGTRSALKFTLVPTSSWAESQALLKKEEVDFLPAMTPTAERREYVSFTPDYAAINRVVVASNGARDLSSLRELKGKRVGIVRGSVEETTLGEVEALPVWGGDEPTLLTLLDKGEADYVLMSVTTLDQVLQKGFSENYEVVYSGNEFQVPLAMAVGYQDVMLQKILTKILLSIRPDEFVKLENKWLSMTLQTGLHPKTVLLWGAVGFGVFLMLVLLFLGWNYTLRRQIRHRKLAEQKLNEQLTFVQTLLNSLPNMVVLRDKEMRITLCNKAYSEVFVGANSGDCWSDLSSITAEERETILKAERQVWATGEVLEGAGFSRRPDDSLFHVIYAKLPYYGPDGVMLGVLTVLTDVNRIKEAEARAGEAEKRLTQITDSMPGIVYQYLWQGPGRGRFLYVSQGAHEILGISQDDIASFEFNRSLFGVTEEALQEVVSKVANHAENLLPLDLEVKVGHAAEDRYLQVRGNFVHQPQGELILNGVIQDITAMKRQEYELREARTYAEQAMQARSRFLATMSHELRTPISGMHGMLELLQMSELNDDQRYMLRNVVTSTNNLLYLVNDVLDFSKMEAGQFQLDYQSCRLQSVICDVIRGHAALAYGKGLHVALNWDPSVPDQANIDSVRVGQVVSNLLNNAVKFTEEGDITIDIAYQQGALVIQVADTGIGIAEEKQDRLFTPFEQVESDINRRFGGTGLGLAICDQLVKKMEGTLTLNSRVGEGARFTFTVPLTGCQWDQPALDGSEWWCFSHDSALPATLKRMGASVKVLDVSQWRDDLDGLLIADECWLEQTLGDDWQGYLQRSTLKGIVLSAHEALRGRMGSERWWRLGKSPLYPDLLQESCTQLIAERAAHAVIAPLSQLAGRVLVADDHPVNRALLARQLAILGVDAQVVEDGEKALRAWQGQHFSLLLTDCHMPVMDGYTLASRLRSQGEMVPIIGVTADTSEEASSRMRAAGMNDMLFKPYPLEMLRQLLARWLPATEAASEPSVVQPEQADEQAQRWLTLFGDEEIARAMAQEYLDSNRKDQEDMMAALAIQDTHALVETAHRIKGAARMVGQQALAAEAAQLENAARLKQLDELADLCMTVQAMMDSITCEIGLWLDE